MENKQRRATTEELTTYSEGQVLPHEIKVTFGDGKKGAFTPLCAHCKKPFATGTLKGKITQPLSHVAAVKAVGLCRSCGILSTFNLRFRSNGVLEQCHKGVWISQEPPLSFTTFVERLKTSARGIIPKIIAFLIVFMPLVIAVLKMPR